MNKIKKGERILLLGKNFYLVEAKNEFFCQYGKFDLNKIIGKRFGIKIKTHLGQEFTVIKPNLIDFLKKAKRMPQVVLPKDASLILAETGIDKNSVVLDAGSGSGFLTIFLANHVKKVYTYEKRKEFYSVAKENIKNSGLKNIIIKNKDVLKSREKNIDLITLDLEKPEKVIKHGFNSLKTGGWLVVFSPYFEQVESTLKEIKKYSFTEPRTIENSQREWRIELTKKGTFSRPKPYVMHTGFLTFTRKL